MNNDELYLKQRLTAGSPYRVPDGYFDTLEQRVMERVVQAADTGADNGAEARRRLSPAAQARVVSLRRLTVAASVALLLAAGATLFFQQRAAESGAESMAQQVAATADDDYIDEAADYLMADNNAIYTYLAYE